MSRLDLLRQTPLFAGLTDAELETLARDLGHHTFAPGVIIFHRGAPGNTLYLVEFGRVRIFLLGDAGQEITLNFHDPGECFGEIALLTQAPRTASVRALDATRLLALHKGDFDRLLARDLFINRTLELESSRRMIRSRRSMPG